MSEQNTKPTINSTEVLTEAQKIYIGNMRGLVAREIKLTFTLPRPGEGLISDRVGKGIGAANIYG